MNAGHGYLSELVIPIIENTPHEADLADSLGEAIRKYPKARRGVFIYKNKYILHFMYIFISQARWCIDWWRVDKGSNGGAWCWLAYHYVGRSNTVHTFQALQRMKNTIHKRP